MYEKGIKSGDISFEHEYDINRLEEELAKVIAKAITELGGKSMTEICVYDTEAETIQQICEKNDVTEAELIEELMEYLDELKAWHGWK